MGAFSGRSASPFGSSIDLSELGYDTATQAELDAHAALSPSGAHGSIVDTDVDAAAAIAYSKLDLAGAIQEADLAFSTATQAELDAHATDTANPHSVSHGQLSGVGASDHHSRYSDNEARSAVGGRIDVGSYTGNGSTTGRTIALGLNARIVAIQEAGADAGWVVFAEGGGLNRGGSQDGQVHLSAGDDLVVGDGNNTANVNGTTYHYIAIGS